MTSHRLYLYGLALVAMLLAVGNFVLFRRTRPEPLRLAKQDGRPATSHPGRGPDGPSAGTRPAEAQGSRVAPDLSDLDDVLDIRPPRGTMGDLTAKGFPVMSNPRRAAYVQTARQTTAEVVADLGNEMTLTYCSGHIDAQYGVHQIGRYWLYIPRHIKVLRLIEEGRRKPEAVSKLLREAIARCVADYDRARKAWDKDWRRFWAKQRGNPVTGDADEYYNRHRRYEDPLLEFPRLHHAAYSAFYILADMGKLDPTLLAEWIRPKKPWRFDCYDMNVWLIDCYFRQTPGQSAAEVSHLALLGGVEIGGKRIQHSRWNAAWDIHHFLLAARGVNTSDIQTISVLNLPRSLPPALDKATKHKLIESFLKHAESIDQ